MNRIYKVIWSYVKQAYVVVSELSSQRKKGKSLSKLVTLGLSLLFISQGTVAFAQDAIQNNFSDSEEDIQNISDMEKEGQNEIDVVAGVKYLETPTTFAGLLENETQISIGQGAQASAPVTVAIGPGAISKNEGGIAIGNKAKSNEGAIAIGGVPKQEIELFQLEIIVMPQVIKLLL
ncbi:hypothetical protein GCM10007161_18070 [Ignatzschineria indica]|uniref:ESPR domain-containing protein n=1 Tax=Ignatzschineria indica TaxID=472583 RepID=A0A2U2AIE5_9GAMM|nr:ESPR domain-containing protein [Ignatzschineria indica]PWD82401.1 hypothetical protein DC082_09610 [Ignatzschineria indica]GGZ86707.1 hypothetical protein GCM10007161_18070 [Ignatzschineria indica]